MLLRLVVFFKTKKLHKIEAVQMEDGTISAARADWHDPLQKVYYQKWVTKRLQLRSSIVDLIASTVGGNFRVEFDVITRAVGSIARPSARNVSGVSVLIVRVFVFGHLSVAVALFTNLFSNLTFMQSFCVVGSIYGTDFKHPLA